MSGPAPEPARPGASPLLVDAAAQLVVQVRAAAAGWVVDVADQLSASPRPGRRRGRVDPGAVDMALLIVMTVFDQLATAGDDTPTARAIAAAAVTVLARAVLRPDERPAAAARLRRLTAGTGPTG